MKKSLLVLMAGLIFMLGCTKATAPIPVTGTITGKLMLKAGISGDLSNTAVRLYSDPSFTQLKYEEAMTGSNPYTYTFDNVDPGTYYLLCWKDLSGNSEMDWNDFIDWWTTDTVNLTPTSITVTAGETKNLGTDTIPYSNLNTASYMFVQDSIWTDDFTGDTLKLRTSSLLHGTLDSIKIDAPDTYHDGTLAVNANFESRQYHIWMIPSDTPWPSGVYTTTYYGTGTLATLTMPFEVSF